MKKRIRRFLIITILLFLYIPTVVYGEGVAGLPLGNKANSEIVQKGGKILGIAQIIAIGVATIMLVVIAIKYISASPTDKAEIKKHAVVYVVGAVFIYAATGIITIISNFANDMAA